MARHFFVIRILSAVLAVSCVASCQASEYGWHVKVDAQYQGINPATMRDDQTLDKSGASKRNKAQPPASTPPDPNSHLYYAEGNGESKRGGFGKATLISHSYASGSDSSHGPPDDQLKASSDTSNKVLWMPRGPQHGQIIDVEISLDISGNIAASQFVGPGFLANASAEFGLTLFDNNVLRGTATAQADPNDPYSHPQLNVAHDWQGRFRQGAPWATNSDYGDLPQWHIDTHGNPITTTFPYFVGTPLPLDFLLNTKTETGGPREAFTKVELGASYFLNADSLPEGQITFEIITESAPDLNFDGQTDCVDVDLLVATIAVGSYDPDFDLSRDGTLDLVDLEQWLAIAGAFALPSSRPFQFGDANLDGVVDGLDFLIWNDEKFTGEAAWCSGDFNADGVVDGWDFLVWNANKFTSPDNVSAVPETAARILSLAALLCLSVVRLRR